MSKKRDGNSKNQSVSEEIQQESQVEDGMAGASTEEGLAAGADQDTPTVEPSTITVSEDEYQALIQERDSLKDQMLRLRADSENFRRRMVKEKEDSVAYANSALISDILTVIDNLERALQSSQESEDFKNLYDGVSLMERDFLGLLEKKWGLKKMVDIESEPFDPEKHEAFLKESCPKCSTDIVGQVLQNGYYLHDRVLRSAKVKVLVPES